MADQPTNTELRTTHLRAQLPTRVSNACERCRLHKSRCDTFRPCALCIRANAECRYNIPTRRQKKLLQKRNEKRTRTRPSPLGRSLTNIANQESSRLSREDRKTLGINNLSSVADYGNTESTIGIAQIICNLGRDKTYDDTTSAIPGYSGLSRATNADIPPYDGQRFTIPSIIGAPFPSPDQVNVLMEDYFESVHWFSLVIYEPVFRTCMHTVADGFAYPAQKGFLLLLATVLGMAAWYRSKRNRINRDASKWKEWSETLLGIVESNIVTLMDQTTTTAIQTCILLGSHYVYHGRPNLSFSLLGAVIKMSHAIGLHREFIGDFDDIEQRKRIWWTIYTWDRFASLTYGRPLSINDNDCNIDMPAYVPENPVFVTTSSNLDCAICYSTYQRELNRLYLIASPALETIFGSRAVCSSKQGLEETYVAQVEQATLEFHQWRQSLPKELSLNLENDIYRDEGQRSRACVLQALSLQLTYDNLLIVLHRPVLARHIDVITTAIRREDDHSRTSTRNGPPIPLESFSATCPNLWVDAATRIARVSELPGLSQLASESHLVAFLAINVFNSAIVLAVMAISEPLSDFAQCAKRSITRILQLQNLMERHSTLSRQTTAVIRDIVSLVLRRESEAMFDLTSGKDQQQPKAQQSSRAIDGPSAISAGHTAQLLSNMSMSSIDTMATGPNCSYTNWTYNLDESLSSVQSVIAPNDSRFSSVNGDHRQDYFGNNLGHASSHTEQANSSRMSMEGIPNDDIESGIPWLWDMTWINGL